MTFPPDFGHPNKRDCARMSDMARKKRRVYTAEQKEDAVAAAKACGSAAQVARDLGIHGSVVSAWVRKAEIDAGNGPEGALTTDERTELVRLRREIRVLEQERAFLKKASAFFAKESDPRTR